MQMLPDNFENLSRSFWIAVVYDVTEDIRIQHISRCHQKYSLEVVGMFMFLSMTKSPSSLCASSIMAKSCEIEGRSVTGVISMPSPEH